MSMGFRYVALGLGVLFALGLLVAGLGMVKAALTLDRDVYVDCTVVLETGVGCVAYVKPPADFRELVSFEGRRHTRDRARIAILHITLKYRDLQGQLKTHVYAHGDLYGSTYQHQVENTIRVRKAALQSREGTLALAVVE